MHTAVKLSDLKTSDRQKEAMITMLTYNIFICLFSEFALWNHIQSARC